MFSFALRCLTDAYNPDVLVAVHMGNEQNPARPRHSNGDKALFRCGMIRVWIRYRQRITKYGRGLLERNPVLSAIPSSFARIPFKIHHFILPRRFPREQSARRLSVTFRKELYAKSYARRQVR